MLLSFLRWRAARLFDLVSDATRWRPSRLAGGVVVSCNVDGEPVASLRRKGILVPISVVAAARFARRKPVILHVPPNLALVRRHVIPAIPARDVPAVLRHELSRISPFAADELFWQWTAEAGQADRARMNITLTMVPKMAIRPAMARLESLGLMVDFIAAGSSIRAQLLPIRTEQDRRGHFLTRALTAACVCLAVAVLGIPIVRQVIALRRTEMEIMALQPAVAEARTLRGTLTAGDVWREITGREENRVGNVLCHLATLTRILPDNAYLTNLALRERHAVLNGRAGSAAHLMTLLSADRAVVDPAFAAPVMRGDGAVSDTFMITATLMP